MKLNTGIIAHSLPVPPKFLCGNPDHNLVFSDVRFFRDEKGFFDEDILYFTEWGKLRNCKHTVPAYMFCVGGDTEAADFFKRNSMTGIITEDEDLLNVFSIIQSIFLRFNQLENNLMAALNSKTPTKDILSCCAEFFQNQVILYDSERNLIDYGEHYLPDADDIHWKEILETRKRPKKMYAEVRKTGNYLEAVRTPSSDFMDLGPTFPKIMTYSFFENGKRLATLTVVETNKPLSLFQLKLLDYIAGLLSPSLFHIYTASDGVMESLRSVLAALLNKENVDPLIVTRCISSAGWEIDDDYLLILINMPEAVRNADTLTRYRHIYERIFPECIVFKYKDSLIVVVHNDTGEVMSECLPKLEKQLGQHDAVCGMSFPFKGILQLGAHYVYADMAVHNGDKNKRIRPLGDAVTTPIVNRIAADIPLYPLCHREAIRIYEYDVRNGTELLLTLETYLMQYKSLKAAAEELFIHRSTLTYRLGCIEKIAKLSLDDPGERLHILLSCIMLRCLGRKGE
jgi:hypothetical protein